MRTLRPFAVADPDRPARIARVAAIALPCVAVTTIEMWRGVGAQSRSWSAPFEDGGAYGNRGPADVPQSAPPRRAQHGARTQPEPTLRFSGGTLVLSGVKRAGDHAKLEPEPRPTVRGSIAESAYARSFYSSRDVPPVNGLFTPRSAVVILGPGEAPCAAHFPDAARAICWRVRDLRGGDLVRRGLPGRYTRGPMRAELPFLYLQSLADVHTVSRPDARAAVDLSIARSDCAIARTVVARADGNLPRPEAALRVASLEVRGEPVGARCTRARHFHARKP